MDVQEIGWGTLTDLVWFKIGSGWLLWKKTNSFRFPSNTTTCFYF